MDFLTNPFTTALLFFYQFLGQNIVLSIVIFTIATRLLTYPLTYQQIKSSRSMQELQPKLKKLQEKYKGDREKLAQEQMKMYKEHGVNPAAGCLPLLIQFPILIGLYGAIGRSLAATPLQLLDLQHRLLVPSLSHLVPLQNTFLWLNLGQPDTFYILPVLVVATTWLQQKLITPPPAAGADPKDPTVAMSRNMTLMMPLMIGLFSLSFASGLSIYWIVSNLVGIAQYGAMGKIDFRAVFLGKPSTPQLVEADDAPPSKKKQIAASSDDSASDEPQKKTGTGRTATAKAKASKAK